MSGYMTVAEFSRVEIVEKRSRFIATVVPVKNEEEATLNLNKIKKEFSDARHNVYAWSVRENNASKFSDDGEPQQTAGLPIMDLIKKTGMQDVLIVVTRYFGGILLGTGGLVHAYTKAAKEGLIAAKPVKMMNSRELLIKCDYNLSGKIQGKISECGYIQEDVEYTDEVLISVCVPEEESENFKGEIIDLSFGKANVTLGDIKYKPIYTKID